MGRAALLRALLLLLACGGVVGCASSTVVISPTTGAILSLSAASARAAVSGTLVDYSVFFKVTEAGGRVGATITRVSYSFDNGLDGSREVTLDVFPGVVNDFGPIDILHDQSGAKTASRVTIEVSWVDAAGRPGSAAGSGTVAVETISRNATNGTLAHSV